MLQELQYKNSGKGAAASPVLADDRATLIRPHLGKYAQAAREGNLFRFNAPAAVLPIFSNTAQVFGIWNPPDSGVYGVIARLRMTYVSTTGAAGGYVFGLIPNVTQLIGTAAPISANTAATEVMYERGLLGSSQSRGKLQAFTALTVTAGAARVVQHLGLNQLVLTATDATNPLFQNIVDFDGETQLKPGNMLLLCGNIATLTTWQASLDWIEDPI